MKKMPGDASKARKDRLQHIHRFGVLTLGEGVIATRQRQCEDHPRTGEPCGTQRGSGRLEEKGRGVRKQGCEVMDSMDDEERYIEFHEPAIPDEESSLAREEEY